MVDNNQSIISWVGSKPAGKHNGQIKIKSGEMHFKNGGLESGKFTADMKSIHVLDLKGDEKKDLENHLKGRLLAKKIIFLMLTNIQNLTLSSNQLIDLKMAIKYMAY